MSFLIYDQKREILGVFILVNYAEVSDEEIEPFIVSWRSLLINWNDALEECTCVSCYNFPVRFHFLEKTFLFIITSLSRGSFFLYKKQNEHQKPKVLAFSYCNVVLFLFLLHHQKKVILKGCQKEQIVYSLDFPPKIILLLPSLHFLTLSTSI